MNNLAFFSVAFFILQLHASRMAKIRISLCLLFCVLMCARISSCDRHQTVHERLGVDQGYDTNLGDDTPFGNTPS